MENDRKDTAPARGRSRKATPSPSSAGKVDIENSGASRTRARPGKVTVDRGKEVTFRNGTGDPVRLYFPNPEIFKRGRPEIVLPPSGSNAKRTLTVREDAEPDDYPYGGVRVRNGRPELVEGNSDPVIIIR